MKEVLCNTERPALLKLALLTNNKLKNVHRRPTRDGIKTYCQFNGELMTTSEAARKIRAQIESEEIVFVNHSGHPIRLLPG